MKNDKHLHLLGSCEPTVAHLRQRFELGLRTGQHVLTHGQMRAVAEDNEQRMMELFVILKRHDPELAGKGGGLIVR